MRVLDTDTLSLAFSGHARVAERLRNCSDVVVTTIITRIEILRGRFEHMMKAADGDQLIEAQRRLIEAETDLAPLRALPIDRRSANEFDRLRQNRRLRKIGRADVLIASIVLAHPATLVTRNLRDFELVPGLRIENWAD